MVQLGKDLKALVDIYGRAETAMERQRRLMPILKEMVVKIDALSAAIEAWLAALEKE